MMKKALNLILFLCFAVFPAAMAQPRVSWGSIDKRYVFGKEVPPSRPLTRLKLSAWRGERVMAQALVFSPDETAEVSFSVGDFRGRPGVLPSSCAEAGFVTLVWTDGLNPDGGGCGYRPDHSQFDSSLVADRIDFSLKQVTIEKDTFQPAWIAVDVPRSLAPGLYRGNVSFCSGGKTCGSLVLEIDVSARTLPEKTVFDLDLWQNPFAVARVEGVPLWSEAHFAAMRPMMERLARAGQKTVTASIMHHPWNGQTFDPFTSMVTWRRSADGGWHFGYEVFDRWVEFMFSCGIDGRINCYSMVPWALDFPYYDEATATMQSVHASPGEPEYDALWTAMLKSFARHLKEKGWFERTAIAMDERPLDMMLRTLDVIRAGDPGFHVSLAGNWYPELSGDVDAYCIPIAASFPEEELRHRKAQGFTSTVYTCCVESYPNTFTFSPPAEATWIGYHVAARGLDGYLRWAYNSWPEDPVHDSRFRTWAAGDTFLVYPGDCPSVRFERLFQGIQAYEKIRLLRLGAGPSVLAAIDAALSPFSLDALRTQDAADAVNRAAATLRQIEKRYE